MTSAERGELVLQGRSRFRLLPFLGPAFIAAVAYIDPGNFATNIAGGSKFGYTLVWVIVASNLMAMLIQTLSAKLGIATGRNLAEVCRDEYPRRVVIGLWVQAELIAIATDLAEFLGAALWLHLVFGLGLFVSEGIIRGHRGRLLVESKEGAGSRFTVQLPRETMDAALADGEPAASASA